MTKLLTKDNPPELLFKYRSLSNKFHLRLLTHQEIYFASPSSFNDPFDGNIPVRWDLLNYEDCLRRNLRLTQIFHNDKPLSVQKQIAIQITDSKDLWHPEKIKKESQADMAKWNNLIGLVSLSEIKDEILMWSHYSDFHKGFVVGLYSDSLLNDYDFDYLCKIDYQKGYPLISGDDDITERFRKKYFIKSSAWDYESEWRISKNHINNRLVTLRKETFAEIIFGCQVEESERKNLVKEIRRNFEKSIKIFQAIKEEENFELKLELIE